MLVPSALSRYQSADGIDKLPQPVEVDDGHVVDRKLEQLAEKRFGVGDGRLLVLAVEIGVIIVCFVGAERLRL